MKNEMQSIYLQICVQTCYETSQTFKLEAFIKKVSKPFTKQFSLKVTL